MLDDELDVLMLGDELDDELDVGHQTAAVKLIVQRPTPNIQHQLNQLD